MTLKTDGLTTIQYPDNLRSVVQEAARVWKKFLNLSNEEKDKLASDDPQFGSGYERKLSGEHGSGDLKENFDIQPTSLNGLRLLSNNPAAQSLIDISERLLQALEPVAVRFCEDIELTYNIDNFTKIANASSGQRFLRYLYYPPCETGKIIGQAHNDHSGYTFHLFESTGGCSSLHPENRTWQPMTVDDGNMIAFAGMQLQLLSKGSIPALSHEIIANQETSQNGRIAIVCFNVLNGVPVYDRKSHGRLQEKPAGFNYDMDSEEFEKLFTDSH